LLAMAAELPTSFRGLVITNETFISLIKFEVLRSQRASQSDFRRLRAAAALAYCAGLWFPEIMALRRRDWLQGGIARISIEGNSQRPGRMVPASPAAIWAVRQITGMPTAIVVSAFMSTGGEAKSIGAFGATKFATRCRRRTA
jgi:hypothetical protein